MATADRAAEVFSSINQPRGLTLVELAKTDPALAARIDDAVRSFDETGSQRDLLRLLSETTGMTDARAARMPDEPYAMPSKPSTTDVERRLVEQDLGAGVASGSPQSVRSALDEIIAADGGDNLIARLAGMTPKPEYSLDIFSNPSILSQANTDILPPSASVSDVMPGAAVPSSPGTALIPAGPRGLATTGGGGLIVPPGRGLATTGGPRDLSVQGMESPAPRGLPAPNQPRIEGPGQRRIEGPTRPESFVVDDGAREAYQRMADGRSVTRRGEVSEDEYADLVARDLQRQPFITSPRTPDAPRDPQLDAIAEDYARRPGQGGGSPPGRNPPAARAPAGGGGRRNWLPGAIAAAGGAGAFKLGLDMLVPPDWGGGSMGDAEMRGDAAGSDTADLAAETSPPPRVPVASGELTPREQAHEMIAKLNLMRRNAGGEVPEAPAMQREINRLLALSNQTMAAASRGEVAMAGNDPHAQATRLLAQLNQMRREAGGEVPQARQIMAEVARLQQMGDAQRNASTTAFPRRAG